MKGLQDALGLAWDCHDSCYDEWLRKQGAEPPPRHPPFPALPESGWGLAVLVPWKRPEALEAAWQLFLHLYGGDLIRHLSWTVAGGGGCGCAVLVRGLDAVPSELYRSLDRLVGTAERVFWRPNRVALGPEAEEFACWCRAYRALADAE